MYFYNKGKDRLEKELDIKTYYKKLKSLEIMIRTLFTEQDKYLIGNQRDYALDSLSSSESLSDSTTLFKDLSAPMSKYTKRLIRGVSKPINSPE